MKYSCFDFTIYGIGWNFRVFEDHEYVMILATIENLRQFVLLFQFAVQFVYISDLFLIIYLTKNWLFLSSFRLKMYLRLSQIIIMYSILKQEHVFFYCLKRKVYSHKLVSKQVFELWEIISSQSKKGRKTSNSWDTIWPSWHGRK